MLDENLDIQHHCWVGTTADTISYMGKCPPPKETTSTFGEVYEGSGKLLMPGFYNAHSHAPMVLLRGYVENLPLQTWLYDKVFPFEAKLTEEDCYWGTLLACAESARYGVVSLTDMYYNSFARARAVVESSMKANLCEGLLAFEDKPYEDYPIYELNERLVDEYHNAAEGRIKIDYNIHAEYTSSPSICARVAEIAHEKGLTIHLHASETKTEHLECKERQKGLTPIQYFDSLGVFDGPAIAAHCVWVEEEDLDIIQRKQVFVACNPTSNLKLGSGFAPIPEMLARNIQVALGSDGMASNNNHDLLQDLYLMSVIYKGYGLDPALVSPKEALFAATRQGALAQRRVDCGALKVGNKADLCVLDITGPSFCPSTNLLYNIVFAGHGSDVCLTMVDGTLVYRDGIWPTIDIERTKAKTAEATKRIINML
jgi:5-methylthioadenosine/S-adenosylhomocysteine deaminase